MVRAVFSATFTIFAIAGVLGAGPAYAQASLTPETADAVTDGQTDRYSLVSSDGDVLRIDRQNGTVSVCRKKNADWRCNPVPMAEEAYVAEINALAEEVDRLTARLETLEATKGGGQALPPGSALDRPEDKETPDTSSPELTSKDEEELDKVLDFTETAMRRFFGMVRELQKDLDSSGN
jgi:hypothetical protein